ncbi:MAG: uncharacterized protein QOJ07_550 [Thermoleophilaceae bacterium]|nr:uncharacterized protein [Thermoleophilaceae bacterium]
MGVADVETPHGPARVHVQDAAGVPRAALVLGHGAGGGVSAPDLMTASRVALEQGVSVALVEQPYRVAGRRSPPAASRLDEAWLAVIDELRAGALVGLELVTGGRSSGARVACRTAAATGAIGVLCLAFPLHPPQRKGSTAEPKTRLPELEAVDVPVLIVQGERDPFGMPAPAGDRTVAVVPGDHSLRGAVVETADAVGSWLAGVVPR